MTLTVSSALSTQALQDLYLPSGWDTVWRQAKNNCLTTPAWAMFIGDSITWGLGASDRVTKRWASLIKNHFMLSYPLYGEFFQCDESTYFTFNTPANTTVTNNPNGYMTAAAYTGTGANVPGLASFTTPYPCTAIDIIFLDYAVGSWQYKVDGGSYVTVTNVGTGAIYYATLRKVRLTGLANTTHTITFGYSSADNVLNIVGACCYPNTNGLGFAYIGTGGKTMSSQQGAGDVPVDKIHLVSGCNPQGDQATIGYGAMGFPTQPSLAVIALGINDCNNSTGTTDFQTGLRRYISSFRAGVADCPVLILMYSNPDFLSDSLGDFGNTDLWYTYLNAAYDIATSYRCALANVHTRWGQQPHAKGFLSATVSPHPSDAGYADIAAFLQQVL